MNTNALLQFKLATPRLRVCAPVSGASKGQGSRVGVTGAGRQQQKKKGEGRKAGMEEKKWKGEGKRERGADLVLTFPFSPLRQKKKKASRWRWSRRSLPPPLCRSKKSLQDFEIP